MDHGFVAVGSHDNAPAVWSTTDGQSWTAIVLGLPAGASSAMLQQVAVNGNRVAVLGQQRTQGGGTAPLAEISLNEGAGWQVVRFGTPDLTVTALAAGPGGGFTAAGQSGPPGQQQVGVWTSSDGTAWTRTQVGGMTAGGSAGLSALAPSGPAVAGLGVVSTQASQQPVAVTLAG
jgi:hypothetical protein